MGFQLLDKSAIYMGRATNPTSLTIPRGLISILIGFEIFVWAFATFVLVRQPDPSTRLPDEINTVKVFQCYIQTYNLSTCNAGSGSAYGRVRFNSYVSNGMLVIDGRDTLRCALNLCVNSTGRANLTFLVANSVLNLGGLVGDGQVVTYPIAVKDNVDMDPLSSTVQVNKIYIAAGQYNDIFINVTRGIAAFWNVVSTGVHVRFTFGSVTIANQFVDRPFTLAADVQDNNYCIASQMQTLISSACVNVSKTYTSGNTTYVSASSRCPVYTSWVSGSTLPAFPVTTFDVYTTSLYVNNQRDYDNPELYAKIDTRVAGAGMSQPVALDPQIIENLLDTQNWKQLSTIDDYIQAIEIVTPGLGMIMLHSSRSILLEIGPEWLSFYSAFALRPNYRHMYSLLTHYGCHAEVGSPFVGKESLTALILQTASDYDKYNANQIELLLTRFVTLPDQHALSEAIYNYANEFLGVVAFSSPATEWTDPNDLLGNRWVTYRYSKNVQTGMVTTEPLVASSVGIAVQAISGITAAAFALFIVAVMFQFRMPILRSWLLIPERQLLRTSVQYKEPCPYHYYFGVLQVTSWVGFRICMYFALDVFARLQKPLFVRFLKFFYRRTKGDADAHEDRTATQKLTKGMALSNVVRQFKAWAMLRYIDVSTLTDDKLDPFIEEFGARRVPDDKSVVSGLARRDEIKATAQFSLEYTALQNFFHVTGRPTDQILLDDIYMRALVADERTTEENVTKKLRQWNLTVSTRSLDTIRGIRPIHFTRECLLADEEVSRLVGLFEGNCSSFPSWGFVEYNTSGTENRYLRIFARVLWIIFESVLVTALTFMPFVMAYIIAVPLDLEHSRYSTTTSILQVHEIQYAVTDISAPRPQNPISSTIFAAGLFFIVLMLGEPLLVLATFTSVANWRNSSMNVVFILKSIAIGLRIVVTSLALFILVALYIFMLWYVATVMIWWLLGAIIAPNRMLVYASSVFTFCYVTYGTFSNLWSMRQTAIKRLEEKILEQVLRTIRASPAKGALDSLTSKLSSASQSRNKLRAASQKDIEVTTGMLIDVAGEDLEKRAVAMEQLSVALSVPPVFIHLSLAVFTRKPTEVEASVTSIFETLRVPKTFEPITIQLAFAALKMPVTATALTHGFYDIIGSLNAEARNQLLDYDEVIVELVQAALKRNVDPKHFASIIVDVGAAQAARLLAIDPNLLQGIVHFAIHAFERQTKTALADLAQIFISVKSMLPTEPSELRPLVQLIIELLLLAANQKHNLMAASIGLLSELKLQSPLLAVLRPLMDATGSAKAAVVPHVKRALDVKAAVEGVSAAQASEAAQREIKLAAQEELRDVFVTIAAMVVQTVETKYSVSADQQNTLLLLLSLIDGDPTALKSVDPLLLKAAGFHLQPLQDALKHVDSFLRMIQNQAFVISKIIECGLTSVPTDSIANLVLYHEAKAEAAWDGCGAFRSEVIGAAESMRRAYQVLQDHKQLTSPDELLVNFIADQWMALLSLLTFAPVLPEELCNYEAFENVVGVPAQALRIFRTAVEVVMKLMATLTTSQGVNVQELRLQLLCAALTGKEALKAFALKETNKMLNEGLAAIEAVAKYLFKEQKFDMKFDCNISAEFIDHIEKKLVASKHSGDTLEAMQSIMGAKKRNVLDSLSESVAMVQTKVRRGSAISQVSGIVTVEFIPQSVAEEILVVLASAGVQAIRGNDVDVVALIKNVMAVIIRDSSFLNNAECWPAECSKLITSLPDNDAALMLFDDVVDFMLDPDTKNIDFDALAAAFDVPPKTIATLLAPHLMIERDETLQCLQLFLRALQGVPADELIVAAREDIIIKFLRLCGYHTDDFRDIIDNILSLYCKPSIALKKKLVKAPPKTGARRLRRP